MGFTTRTFSTAKPETGFEYPDQLKGLQRIEPCCMVYFGQVLSAKINITHPDTTGRLVGCKVAVAAVMALRWAV